MILMEMTKSRLFDIMKVAGRWNTFEGGDGYELIYDLDGDGDIDVVDIMGVAGKWEAYFGYESLNFQTLKRGRIR